MDRIDFNRNEPGGTSASYHYTDGRTVTGPRGTGDQDALRYLVETFARRCAYFESQAEMPKSDALPESVDTDVDPDGNITFRITEVEVSFVPTTNINYRHYALKVQRRIGDRFSVVNGHDILNRNGGWDFEWVPDEDPEQWRHDHQFGLAEAQQRAALAAPDVVVNGLSARQLVAMGLGEGRGEGRH